MLYVRVMTPGMKIQQIHDTLNSKHQVDQNSKELGRGLNVTVHGYVEMINVDSRKPQ